ncbi:MAG: 2OG-Fe(II) oxygenase [Chitinophagaceae bacterium]|nr:2OG-Fe(II) oxygenase [Chitinophagaceae bacterium]
METTQFDTLIDSYLSNKAGIDKNFLSDKLVKGLQQNISQLDSTNKMTQAGIGNAAVKDSNQKMRGDKIYWLDKTNNNAFEQEFLELAESFIAHLNSSCYTGIHNYEFHYAVYEAGSYYKKHIDQFQSDNKRKFSFINYLNDDWQEADGGQLHLYYDGEVQKIEPQSKTAVFFKSNEMEHEVVLCNRSRMSISGWLKSS